MRAGLLFAGFGLFGLWLLYRMMQGLQAPPETTPLAATAEPPVAEAPAGEAEAVEPVNADPAPPVAAPSAREPVAASQAPEQVNVRVRVENGRLAEGPDVIRLRQGQRLSLTIETDAEDELHLHGYDRHLHLHAGQPATLELLADRSGRFEYELHGKHAVIGVLEVFPN